MYSIGRRLRAFGLVFVAAGTMVACAPRGLVYVRTAPPPRHMEERGERPGRGFVWIAGFWRWDHRDYVWVPGHWVRRPYTRALWVPGRWKHGHRGWYWTRGHWR